MIKMKEHASMPSNPRKSPSVRLLHGKAEFHSSVSLAARADHPEGVSQQLPPSKRVC